MRWVHGRRVRNGAAFVRPGTLRLIGRTTAMLHEHARRFGLPSREECRQLDDRHFVGAQCCAGQYGCEILTPPEHDLVRRAADKIRLMMRRLRDRPDQFGLIHGDLEPPNWIFHGGEARPIDFDEFGAGFFLFDLMQVLWSHAMWPDYARLRVSLLQGYESVRPISSDLKPLLNLFQAIAFVEWSNHRLVEGPEAQSELRRWREPTVQRIAELCEVG